MHLLQLANFNFFISLYEEVNNKNEPTGYILDFVIPSGAAERLFKSSNRIIIDSS